MSEPLSLRQDGMSEATERRIAAFARRLGVSPLGPGEEAYFTYVLPNGERFSLEEVAHALLDRIEGVA